MIRHDIVVNKPSTIVSAFSTALAPRMLESAADKWKYRGILSDQATYEQYLRDCGIRRGDCIKFKHNSKISSAYQIHYVLDIVEEHNKVPFIFDRGHPKPFKLMQIKAAGIAPWIRYDSVQDYMVITPEEYQQYVMPEYAKLQDYIKEYSAASPA